jgi:hypothetical protein
MVASMQNLQYEQFEETFLEAKAQNWFRKEHHQLVFVQRLLASNNDLSNEGLAEVLEKQLLAASKSKDAIQVMRDVLSKTVFSKLESEGCPSKEATKDKRDIAQAWLREAIYPNWLFDYCWQQLSSQAIPSQKMGAVLPETPATLGARRKKSYLTEVPKDSDILFKVDLDSPGHLLLLEREPNGVVCCLCPSEYAPKMSLSAGEAIFPQPEAPDPTFGSDEVGVEQWLAVISPNEFTFDWFAQNKIEAFDLNYEHLLGLLNYVQESKDCQLLYTQYVVTAS